MPEKHLVRRAIDEESKIDCCGDRYPCYTDYACSCGVKLCRSCLGRHLLELHWDKEAEEERERQELKESAERKLAAITPEERKVLGI